MVQDGAIVTTVD